MTWRGLIVCFLMQPLLSNAQFKVEWDFTVDLELSKAGSLSHYYYNEIHRNSTDWSFNLSRSDLITNFQFSDQFRLVAHAFTERDLGQRLGFFNDLDTYVVKMAQLHLNWNSKNQKFGFRLGRMYSPFGLWYQEQRYIDRNILSAPLVYAYYTNVSPNYGYVPNLAEENRIPTPDGIDWGLSTFYRLGYRDGATIRFGNISKINMQLGVFTGTTSMQKHDLDNPLLAISGKVDWPIKYWLKIGAAIDYGTYLMSHLDINNDDFRQTSLSFYYQISSGYFDFSAEFISNQFSAPLYDPEAEDFITEGSVARKFDLESVSFYTTLTYEPPWFSGSFFSLRADLLSFGDQVDVIPNDSSWDDDIRRYSFGIGYKFSPSLSARTTISTQSTDNRQWERHQRVFRAIISYEI